MAPGFDQRFAGSLICQATSFYHKYRPERGHTGCSAADLFYSSDRGARPRVLAAVSPRENPERLARPQETRDYGAIPSVSSILVPHGSVMNATRILLEKLLGVSP